MRFGLLLILIVALSMKIYGQGQANTWYIGQSNGISFAGGVPKILKGFNPSPLDRGYQSISDENGTLLFYTDGQTIWNNQNGQMPNGQGLFGGSWQTLVIQKPSSKTNYYIFTILVDSSNESVNRLYYNEVDMSLDNGLGSVIRKNVFLKDSISQKLATILHQNGTSIWVTTHSMWTNTFFSYLVDSSGVNISPVVNNIGQKMPVNNPVRLGQMRSSPDGSKFAMANEQDFSNPSFDFASSIEFFSFNNSSASMTAPIYIYGFHQVGDGVTGLEFSPNGRLLYASLAGDDTGRIYQYNLCNFTDSAVINSQQIVAAEPEREKDSYYHGDQGVFYQLQLAPDNKIYLVNFPQGLLSIIENPDNTGLACGYKHDGFNTGNYPGGYSLPYFSNSIIHSISKGRFNVTNTCLGSPTVFSLNESVDSAKWNFGEPQDIHGDTSSLISPFHKYKSVGSFTVMVIIYTQCYIDTLSKKITIVSPNESNFLGNDTSLCTGLSYTLFTGIVANSYTWQDSSTNGSFTVTRAGKYWVRIDESGCILSDTINIKYNQTPQVFLGNDTTLCKGSSFILDAGNFGSTFIWDDGTTKQKRVISNSGKYWVNVNSNGCSSSDTIVCNFTVGPSINLPIDTAFCEGHLLILRAGANTATYKWSDGSNADSIIVSQGGDYWVTSSEADCTKNDTVIVTENPVPTVFIGNDTALCTGETLRLVAPTGNLYKYLWADRSTASSVDITSSGTYWLRVTNQYGCYSKDTINVNFKAIPLFSLGRDTSLCAGQSLALKVVLAMATYQWNTGDTSPSITVNNSGIYWLQITDSGCSKTDTITVNFKQPPAVNLGNDTTLCTGQSLILNAANDSATYLWQDGSTLPTYTVDKQGVYSVTVMLHGCDTSGKITVGYLTQPSVDIGKDTTLCIQDKLVLNAYFPQASYQWQDGSTQPQYTVTKDGTYDVDVANACGSVKDSLTVQFVNCACKFQIPTAFTPNGDGKNDVFKPVYKCLFTQYNLEIFNRFGQNIYNSQSADIGWDGTLNGMGQPVGTYVWVVQYFDTLLGKIQTQKGTVVLIR